MEWAVEYGDFRLSQSGTPQEGKNTKGEWANVIDLSLQDGVHNYFHRYNKIQKYRN